MSKVGSAQAQDDPTALGKVGNLILDDQARNPAPPSTTTAKVKTKKGGNKKGANPLKARLKGQANEVVPPTDARSDETPFAAVLEGPIVTLRFSSKAAQHRTLARVETYYEAVDPNLAGFKAWNDLQKTFGGADTPWAAIAERHLCKGYEAFNLPLDVVKSWVGEMRNEMGKTEHEENEDPKTWLKTCCLPEEVRLLEFLESLGVLTLSADNAQDPPDATPPQYLISTTSSTSLLHERLHALYHLSSHYASTVHTQYTTSLSKKSLKVIEHDLKMRGYRDSVWEDEWQAYLLGSSVGDIEGPGEATWGKGPREECVGARDVLRVVVKSEGEKFGVQVPW